MTRRVQPLPVLLNDVSISFRRKTLELQKLLFELCSSVKQKLSIHHSAVRKTVCSKKWNTNCSSFHCLDEALAEVERSLVDWSNYRLELELLELARIVLDWNSRMRLNETFVCKLFYLRRTISKAYPLEVIHC